MRRRKFIALGLGGLVVAALGLPLLVGIWLPDVFFPVHHTLAVQTLPDGTKFHAYQYWNQGDFYNTELLITYPDGRGVCHVLDPDSPKIWRAAMTVDLAHREAWLLRGKRVSW